MEDILIIKDLTFKYNDNYIFDKFNLTIKKGTWTTIIGPNGSGKSTLIKIIMGLLKSDSYIFIDNMLKTSDNIKQIRTKIGVIFEHPDSTFVAETVMDEMAFALENLEMDKKEIQKKVKEVARFLNIAYLLEKNPFQLSGGQKQLVALASILVLEPKILILDEAINRIDYFERNNILEVLSKLNKEKGITIINITHDIEEAVYGDDVILIDKGKIILNGSKELVFREEKVFNSIGIDIPFMAELSLKLMYYNLVDEMIFDMDEMVNKLWI
ncbi:MAG: ATP-binding cassette domain-containing protein [Bacilli bacterium]|nr:ATP-binding cassette domain-containing protein [Bacilli bacterium]MDD4718340.1 ATP-binding cassette domain-containing protein [Bacilli bacterium]